MKSSFPKVNPMGERAILIQFEPKISGITLQKVLFIKGVIEEKFLKVAGEVITSYSSLLVKYPVAIEDIYGEAERLEKVLETANILEKNNSHIFYLPVCYEEEFGLDLEEISARNSISKNDIIRLHSQTVYTVYFTGFLPGFLYLGGLDERLHISRRKEPRLEVKKGAVGIGEKQTGIYPKTSPGGWQIIGNCPVELFQKENNPPCQIMAGDKVKFVPVSKQDYEIISDEIAKGKYELKKEKLNG
ncbi:5-oxoprolinase subunit PxpB [Salinimicrobium sp. GXAS 041]|uniref:5-oxoprolinase subunit PxpB n=1 Tax=Salinimicrobium sp. GXAS 041 TaxID=3400806 RepID=UPI003C7198C7